MISAGHDCPRVLYSPSFFLRHQFAISFLRPSCSHGLHYTREAQHTVPMTTRSLSYTNIYIANSRAHPTLGYPGESASLAGGVNARARTRYMIICFGVQARKHAGWFAAILGPRVNADDKNHPPTMTLGALLTVSGGAAVSVRFDAFETVSPSACAILVKGENAIGVLAICAARSRPVMEDLVRK